MKTIIFIFIIIVSTRTFGASPLEVKDSNFFNTGLIGYSNPSLSYLRFQDSEYLKLNPGYLWLDDIYLTIMDIQLLGNDFFAKKEDGEKVYVNTMYLSILKIGGFWKYHKFKITADVHFGFLYTNYLKEIGEVNSYIDRGIMGAAGISLGLLWKPEKWSLMLEFSTGGTSANVLINSYFDINYHFKKNWKVGAFIETAQRELTICKDNNNPECSYLMRLNFGAVYFAWKFYKKFWFLFGIGANSIELGYSDNLTKDSAGGSLYFSIR